jgi:hypothetical protein
MSQEFVDESNTPQTAQDLLWPEITLKYRQNHLDKINTVARKLRDLELKYIIPSENPKNEDVVDEIDFIARQCDYKNLKSTCENGTCALGPTVKIPVYENYCPVCRGDKNLNLVQNRLSTVRNIKNRITYLEFQLSASLANQLSRDELYDNLAEIDRFAALI